MDTLISRLRKNASEEIWVALSNYQGRDLLNIRAYFRGVDGFQPTRKGVAVGISKLKELRDALQLTLEREITPNEPIVIKKNSSEEIRIYKSEYMGHLLMNIRVFYHRKEETEMQPGPKGIAFNVNLTNEIIRAIDSAIGQTANPSD